jgi:hypothetical protein
VSGLYYRAGPRIKQDVNQNAPEELPHEDQPLAPNVETSEHGGKDHHLRKEKSGGRVGDFNVRTMHAEEPAKLHQEKRVSHF